MVSGLPGWLSGKESACQCRRHKGPRFDCWGGKIPWSRKWQPTPVLLPGESHGQKSLAGYSPRGHREVDMTESCGAENQGSLKIGMHVIEQISLLVILY